MPQVAVAEPAKNGDQALALVKAGDKAGVALMVFPELCLSAYAIDDLLFQDAVLDAVAAQVERLVAASGKLSPVFVVGAPLRREGRLYNCARGDPPRAAARRGAEGVPAELPRVLRAAPFHLGRGACAASTIAVAGHAAPFGIDLLFAAGGDSARFTFHVEICEDLWVPHAAERAPARRPAPRCCSTCRPATSSSARRRCGGCCAPRNRRAASPPTPIPPPAPASRRPTSPGTARPGSSRSASELAETERFSARPEMAVADVDLGRIRQERMRTNTLRRQRPPAARGGAAVPPGRIRVRRARRAARAAAPGRALPVRARRPGDAGRQLLRGLQHPGPGAGAAAHGDRPRRSW